MTEDRPVGQLLREWRHRRKLSQLDLAIQANVSARHISFVETGRTIPSSEMVLHLAEHLGVPLRERNRLLVAAGHAPLYRQRPLDDPDMARTREALEQFVRAHEPFPALAVDRRWNLILANKAIDVVLDGVDPALLNPPVNMMRLGLHPERTGTADHQPGAGPWLPAATPGPPGSADRRPGTDRTVRGTGRSRGQHLTTRPGRHRTTHPHPPPGHRTVLHQRDHHVRRGVRHHTGGDRRRDLPTCHPRNRRLLPQMPNYLNDTRCLTMNGHSVRMRHLFALWDRRGGEER